MHIRAENIEFSIACTWLVSLTYITCLAPKAFEFQAWHRE